MSVGPFNELLKAEQQVTTIKAILHHLEATGLLSEAAMSVNADVLARQIAGIEGASSDSSPSTSRRQSEARNNGALTSGKAALSCKMGAQRPSGSQPAASEDPSRFGPVVQPMPTTASP